MDGTAELTASEFTTFSQSPMTSPPIPKVVQIECSLVPLAYIPLGPLKPSVISGPKTLGMSLFRISTGSASPERALKPRYGRGQRYKGNMTSAPQGGQAKTLYRKGRYPLTLGRPCLPALVLPFRRLKRQILKPSSQLFRLLLRRTPSLVSSRHHGLAFFSPFPFPPSYCHLLPIHFDQYSTPDLQPWMLISPNFPRRRPRHDPRFFAAGPSKPSLDSAPRHLDQRAHIFRALTSTH